ncbi:MAG: dihydrolipoamide acetyltransferase family protein [Candidatus Humimicrobiaceae bacterium]
MSSEIKMPQLSQTTDEVKITKWLVKEGQEVKRGQALCEVETDKSNMELESFETGSVLKILAESGQTIPAGWVIAIIGEKNEKIPSQKLICNDLKKDIQKSAEKTETDPFKSRPAGIKGSDNKKHPDDKIAFINEDFKATTIVRNMAKLKNIDLRTVSGTGPQGIITKDDLERSYKERSAEVISEEFVLSKNQLLAAVNLTASKSRIPHYYIKTSICADPILRWREKNRNFENPDSASGQKPARRISMYSILVFAAAAAAKKFPKINGYFREDRIISHRKINIGFAVAKGEELFVPVIKDADIKSIFEIDKEIKDLIAKTEKQKFDGGDLSEGTFTISNLGMYDVDEFCAIINPPQAGILAVGKIKKMLHVDEQERISIRNEFAVTGSFDHRIINGSYGAQFLQEFKKTIEERIT